MISTRKFIKYSNFVVSLHIFSFILFYLFIRVQPTSALVTNFVPNSTENMTFTINNQLSTQVQRLVRERPITYEGLYQIYGGRNVGRQYNGRADTFQHQLVSNILCPPTYQAMPSPTKHVVVGSATMQPPLQVNYQISIIFIFISEFASKITGSHTTVC